jgi:hypothetical protein
MLAEISGTKKAYLKTKTEEHETNSKIKNIRDLYWGIKEFKKGSQPRTNIVKVDKDDLVSVFHRILARWRNSFSQIFNVNGVHDVRPTEIQQNHYYLSQASLSLIWLLKT